VKWKIPLYKVLTDKEDIHAVTKVLKRGMDWAIGPEIIEFENTLANFVGSKYCLTFNSGTSALHASLLSLGIKPQNEVLVPSFTFISTVNSVLMVNAKPKFIDIEKENLGIDPSLISKNISKKTKCIIPVHYSGLPCKIKDILQVSKEKKIKLIEDAAESLGATINGKKVGTFGDLGIFSFAGNKVLTTGEGGAIVTDSKKLFEKLKLIRSHGRKETQNYFSSEKKPEYVTLGYNWRMSTLTAALGLSQLNKLEKLIKLRRKNANYLTSKLKKHSEITTPGEPKGYFHAYQLYSIRLNSKKMRNNLITFLKTKGIMTKIFFDPVHLSPFYKTMKMINKSHLKITEQISDEILTLPLYPTMSRESLGHICDSIDEFMDKK
jgi:perosamine synthetase